MSETPPTTTQPHPQRSPLINSLAARLERRDTAALSTLRRALAHLPQTPDNRLWPLVTPYVGDNEAARDTGALTACLWAQWHLAYHAPVNGTYPLGAALRRTIPTDRHRETYDALCFATWDTLPRMLTPLITRCATAGQPLDWTRLQRDLRAWRNGERDTALRRWADAWFNPSTAHIPAPDPTFTEANA